jgi:hypothetical protein
LVVQEEKGEHDAHGCLASVNRAAKAYNKKLSQLCDDMRLHLKDATIVYTDMFAIKYDFVANHTKYGMNGSNGIPSQFWSVRTRNFVDSGIQENKRDHF